MLKHRNRFGVPLLFLFLLAVFSALVVYFPWYELIFLASAAIVMGWSIFCLINWRERIISFLFFLALFVFIFGRELLEIFAGIRRNDYPEYLNTMVYCELLVAVVSILMGYFACNYLVEGSISLSARKRKPKKYRKYGLHQTNIRKSIALNSKLLESKYRNSIFAVFFLVLTVGLVIRLFAFYYVYSHGYKALYTHFVDLKQNNLYLLLGEKLELIILPAFCCLIAGEMSKKRQKQVLISYLIYLGLSLLSGQRFNSVIGLLLVLVYFAVNNTESLLKGFKKHRMRYSAIGITTAFSSLSVFSLVEYIRGTASGIFNNPILNFFYQQGVSILVLKKEILYSDRLNPDVYYSLSAFYYGIIGRIFGNTVYHGNNVENALYGSSLTHALTYATDPNLYLNGGGIGGSFIAEVHHDFGFLGIYLFCLFYGALLFWLDRLGRSYIGDCLRYLIVPAIIWAPRGETTGFIVKLIQPSNLAFIILVLVGIGVMSLLKILVAKIGAFGKEVIMSVSANFIGMLVMAGLTFLLPKALGHQQYSLWQVYIMWAMYGGYLTLGITDGIYIMYAGRKFDELPKNRVGFQFFFMTVVHLLFTISMISIMIWYMPTADYFWIVLAVCTSSLFYVPRTLLTMLMQSTGEITKYSIVTIVERVSYGLLVVLLLFAKDTNFTAVIFADVLAKLLALLLALYYARAIIGVGALEAGEAFSEIKTSIKIGIQILIANLSSVLINGVVRIIIQAKWGISAFGYVSFAFTVSNLFITFILAVSIVLFPYLKRIDEREYANIYMAVGKLLTGILLSCLWLYYPIALLLLQWLPEYDFSVKAMLFLFPMLLFEARYRLLANTYLKALRMETYLMFNNVFAVGLALALGYCACFIFESIIGAVAVISVVLALRCLTAENRLAKKMQISIGRELVVSVLLSLVFLLVADSVSLIVGSLVFGLMLLVVLWLYHPEIRPALQDLKESVTK